MTIELDNGNVLCEQCGNDYEAIGQHWSMSADCSHPDISDYKMELLTGMLMGDGCINRCNKNPFFRTNMIAKPFLEWLDDEFGWLSTGVRLDRTAEEGAKQCRDSGFSPDANVNNYSDVYRLHSRSHPDLQSLADWYVTGKKVFPEDIELTPTVLKMWYVSDGSYDNTDSNNYIKIGMSNEIDRRDNIEQLFENVGFEISNWNISVRKRDGSERCEAQFTVEESRRLHEYMGEPPDGFEYKWPETFK